MWLFMAVLCLIQQMTYSEEILQKRHMNPQIFMTASEIIQYWGYPSEEHEIMTDDGYYLIVHRIPYGMHSSRKTGPNPAVLLVHGLFAEGRSWIANLPINSLGFVLADAGYDVWIINNRGTTWSRRHRNLTIGQEEFWDFSFHEMAIHDIPATINYILQKTQHKGLYYIGHSQGGTIGLLAFSLMPQLTPQIKLFMCLAPGYTFKGNWKLTVFSQLLSERLFHLIWENKEFCLLSSKQKRLSAKLCSTAVVDKLCLQLISRLTGFNQKNLNVSRADVYLGSLPDCSSIKTNIHWLQIAKSKEFKYFDYGSKNKAVYNMTSPPFYRIEDMVVPTALWNAGKDKLITRNNIRILLPQIRHLVFHKEIPDWEHVDFIVGLDAPEQLYPEILDLMQKYK
ncbi:putative lysosomal acid lipase/cholesteryl ester hydrolase [Python bivittatus]|uniref:Lipase n=1 Tax=Python bivittatus TaxID=176946 RepID=A0A9F5IRL4_PYTBI|nr:putative lysosomal acid lipase/cholesteryl ester hydrolase [Python bivittatus]